MVLPFWRRLVFRPVPARILQRASRRGSFQRLLWLQFPVFRPRHGPSGDVGCGVHITVHHPMLGAYGHLVRGVGNTRPAFMAQLRRVRGIYSHDPTAILRHVVSEPPYKSATIPAPVLHRVSDPALRPAVVGWVAATRANSSPSSTSLRTTNVA